MRSGGGDPEGHLPSAGDDGPTPADADASPAAGPGVDGGQNADETASALERHFSILFNAGPHSRKKNHFALTVQGRVYNFLERPTGWKCFLYHFTVYVSSSSSSSSKHL